MLSLEIELLTGRYAAQAFNDRHQAEWPVHPARVFSALVAGWAEGGCQTDEAAALDALAGQLAPEVWTSDAWEREVFETYVPVNDSAALANIDKPLLKLEATEAALGNATSQQRAKKEKARDKAREQLQKRSADSGRHDAKGTVGNAVELLPPTRPKQPRTFPVVIPHDPRLHLVWPTTELESDVVNNLDAIAARVARLGHSSSLVRMRFRVSAPELGERLRWRPRDGGDLVLRVPLAEQRELLVAAHERHQQVMPRVLPYRPQAYSNRDLDEDREVAASPFSSEDWVVYELSRKRRRQLHLSRTEELARALRGAFIRANDGALPEFLSGHDEDGRPSERTHLAFVPLADTGHRHASGGVLGVALVPPRDISAAERRSLLSAVARLGDDVELRMTQRLALDISRVVGAPSRRTLEEQTWSRPSRCWASVTAVALDKNPGKLDSRDPVVLAKAAEAAEDILRESCERAGLPRPLKVVVHRRSMVEGAPAARSFTPFPRRGHGHRRVCLHAELFFAELVRGPILLGAGRYFGLGLFRPISRREG